MRPLSESTARIAGKTFERKYISLGRILSQWSDIVGEDLASKAQPVKIHHQKNNKSGARLDIATSEAHATTLRMQVGLILERLNNIFGDQWITSIRFVSIPVNQDDQSKAIKKKRRDAVRKAPLSGEDENFLAKTLEEIKDSDIKAKLEKLGQAIIKEEKL